LFLVHSASEQSSVQPCVILSSQGRKKLGRSKGPQMLSVGEGA
jgi:hypothetical protein